ncbi:hypothetical protein HK405_011985 [Cladochytrium tenue]|nr:hypothetical protein HK405_011985 [Cladochytrium tenue]
MDYTFDENGALKKSAPPATKLVPPSPPPPSTPSADKTTSAALDLGLGAQAAADADIASNAHAAMPLMKRKSARATCDAAKKRLEGLFGPPLVSSPASSAAGASQGLYQAKWGFDFSAGREDDLSMAVGDIADRLAPSRLVPQKIDANREAEETAATTAAEAAADMAARMYDYDAVRADELTVAPGDRFDVLDTAMEQ